MLSYFQELVLDKYNVDDTAVVIVRSDLINKFNVLDIVFGTIKILVFVQQYYIFR